MSPNQPERNPQKPAPEGEGGRRPQTGSEVGNRPPNRRRRRPAQNQNQAQAASQNQEKSQTQNQPQGQNQNQGQAKPAQNRRGNRPPSRPKTGRPAAAGEAQSSGRSRRTPRRQPAAENSQGGNQPQTPGTARRTEGSPGATRRSRPVQRGTRPNLTGGQEMRAPSVPRKARGGIRARSGEGGEFGKNWWAKRWLLAMERLMDGARLQRGRRYARMGQVLSMNESNGGIVARVQGSRPAPYKVTIRIAPLSDEQWNQVLDILADRALFTAQLLAGEMPATIEEAFSAAGVSLFPARGGDLMTECSCPDWANPCKHIAATHYILGDRFDEDPFLILRLRGRTQEEILQALRQRRTGQEEVPPEQPAEPEVVQSLEDDLAHFWVIGPGLEDYSVNVQPPPISLPLFKRLGNPDFANQFSLEKELGPALDAASQAALFLAFSDINRESSENGEGS